MSCSNAICGKIQRTNAIEKCEMQEGANSEPKCDMKFDTSPVTKGKLNINDMSVQMISLRAELGEESCYYATKCRCQICSRRS